MDTIELSKKDLLELAISIEMHYLRKHRPRNVDKLRIFAQRVVRNYGTDQDIKQYGGYYFEEFDRKLDDWLGTR